MTIYEIDKIEDYNIDEFIEEYSNLKNIKYSYIFLYRPDEKMQIISTNYNFETKMKFFRL